MLTTLAIQNYRSLLRLVMPLGRLNVITGPNGSGKSNLYRALRLLAETAQGGVVHSLSREGGLQSALWAGPERISNDMRQGRVPVQGGPRREPVRLRLGFGSDRFGYAISLGLPAPSRSLFRLDPEIKSERIWVGPMFRPSATLVDRSGPVAKVRGDGGFRVLAENVDPFESIFSCLADVSATPEVVFTRETIRGWRFYDHFRTDRDAPARLAQLGTRTPVLHHDGRDLAAALETIRELGRGRELDRAVDDAFPGARVEVSGDERGYLTLSLHQHGLLRPLGGGELSDGTLRYLLWVAALLTPRPPTLMVLNEPETSLHPDLLPALARLIVAAAERSQVWVITHSAPLVAGLRPAERGVGPEHSAEPERELSLGLEGDEGPAEGAGEDGLEAGMRAIELERELGATRIRGVSRIGEPPWKWPD